MIVIDTSVFTDFLVNFDENRHIKAKSFFDEISERDFTIYEPFLFDVELAGILRRRYDEKTVSKILEDLKGRIEVLDKSSIHKTALDIAMKTHSRAIDAYFIATAKLTNSILITNDKMMANNAKNDGIEAYYLIEEFDKAINRIKELQQL